MFRLCLWHMYACWVRGNRFCFYNIFMICNHSMKLMKTEGKEGDKMRGSFSIEASLIVPLVIAVFVLALRTGIDLYEETRAQAEKMKTEVSFDVVDTMYLLDEITDIGDLFHGD